MKGIHCAFEGCLGRPAEIRQTNGGRPFLKLAVAVGEDDTREWMDVSAWSDHLIELAPHLPKGAEVYCEGTLKLRRWDGPDGVRTVMQVSAWDIKPKGLIGAKKPKAPPKPGARPRRSKADSQAPIDRMTQGAEPFNDEMPF